MNIYEVLKYMTEEIGDGVMVSVSWKQKLDIYVFRFDWPNNYRYVYSISKFQIDNLLPTGFEIKYIIEKAKQTYEDRKNER